MNFKKEKEWKGKRLRLRKRLRKVMQYFPSLQNLVLRKENYSLPVVHICSFAQPWRRSVITQTVEQRRKSMKGKKKKPLRSGQRTTASTPITWHEKIKIYKHLSTL